MHSVSSSPPGELWGWNLPCPFPCSPGTHCCNWLITCLTLRAALTLGTGGGAGLLIILESCRTSGMLWARARCHLWYPGSSQFLFAAFDIMSVLAQKRGKKVGFPSWEELRPLRDDSIMHLFKLHGQIRLRPPGSQSALAHPRSSWGVAGYPLTWPGLGRVALFRRRPQSPGLGRRPVSSAVRAAGPSAHYPHCYLPCNPRLDRVTR